MRRAPLSAAASLVLLGALVGCGGGAVAERVGGSDAGTATGATTHAATSTVTVAPTAAGASSGTAESSGTTSSAGPTASPGTSSSVGGTSTGTSAPPASSRCAYETFLPAVLTVESAVTGAPITDAAFTEVAPSPSDAGLGDETTGSDGVYSLSFGFSSGPFTVAVSAPGYATLTVAGVVTGYDGRACDIGYSASTVETVKLRPLPDSGSTSSSSTSTTGSTRSSSGGSGCSSFAAIPAQITLSSAAGGLVSGATFTETAGPSVGTVIPGDGSVGTYLVDPGGSGPAGTTYSFRVTAPGFEPLLLPDVVVGAEGCDGYHAATIEGVTLSPDEAAGSQSSSSSGSSAEGCGSFTAAAPPRITLTSARTGERIRDATFTVLSGPHAPDAGVGVEQTLEGGLDGVYLIEVGNDSPMAQDYTLLVTAPGYQSLVVPGVIVGYDGRECGLGYVASTNEVVALTPSDGG